MTVTAKCILALAVLVMMGTSIRAQDKIDLINVLNGIFNNTKPNDDPSTFVVPTSKTVLDNEPLTSNKSLSCKMGEECVKHYLCDEGSINEDGHVSNFNVRFNNDDSDSPCPFSEMCCAINDIVEEPIVRPTETATGCGHRNADGVGYRIDAPQHSEAEFGEFPWMLAILRAKDGDDTKHVVYQCGGSLIHPAVALTAAHCVVDRKPTQFAVRAGDWESNTNNELYPHQTRTVKDIVIHSKYNKNNLFNDIALLFLESPFDLKPNVNVVCLPPPGFVFDFSKCFASGWGKDQFENGQYQNVLKKIELPIVPSYVCQDNLRQTRLGRRFRLNQSFICAGGERGKDTCEGDGGSPLVCPIDVSENRYYQAGIVAWGIECGQENIPGVYVNVALFTDWINEQLDKAGFPACKPR